ncbi:MULTISPECIES: polysaccharide pyruvyl transferase family protein [unclassified Spirosoma]|uniref:polysaccharide pyruvyl transferase family protein n=1 Tax=unclassified Spirosoma TaxID=2621999 RepID=UPI00095CA98E|nr:MULTISPECIES: polysaccharide pyruvyl transferase family protein [unclassified Spirosoma]MBN8820906.1 polysaccharide pyruvyl transferase family protein [Spirosoma sp.]OJW75922.1 MAG: polysaccharide pyruvyl transferase [Spirosoma sp. 48-14]
MQDRRTFLTQFPAWVGLLAHVPAMAQGMATGTREKKSIILRSSWQTENIGDIGHTPGVLTLLEKYLPDVEVRLWPSNVANGVEEMLRKRFPAVPIIRTPEEISRAFAECVFLLHGSGPSLVARKDVERWVKETGKPYGIYGITFPGVYGFPEERQQVNPVDINLLTHATFAYFRDSVSLEFAKQKGVRCPIMEFCPDGAFAVDVKNDEAATAFLNEHGLETGKFLCAIPQYRFTPWWELPSKKQVPNEVRRAYNDKMKEQDNAPIREAIIAVVRQTPMKVLLIPENETQVRIGKEMLYDPLPDDVKAKVVWRDHYWLTDEAVSTYIRSAGLFGLEMHSPIMCIANGIPAIVCRFDEQTSKGYMWRDIGLNDWLFDMDTPKDVAGIVPAVLAMAKDPKAAQRKVAKARKFVEQRQRDTMSVLKKNVWSA